MWWNDNDNDNDVDDDNNDDDVDYANDDNDDNDVDNDNNDNDVDYANDNDLPGSNAGNKNPEENVELEEQQGHLWTARIVVGGRVQRSADQKILDIDWEL